MASLLCQLSVHITAEDCVSNKKEQKVNGLHIFCRLACSSGLFGSDKPYEIGHLLQEKQIKQRVKGMIMINILSRPRLRVR